MELRPARTKEFWYYITSAEVTMFNFQDSQVRWKRKISTFVPRLRTFSWKSFIRGVSNCLAFQTYDVNFAIFEASVWDQDQDQVPRLIARSCFGSLSLCEEMFQKASSISFVCGFCSLVKSQIRRTERFEQLGVKSSQFFRVFDTQRVRPFQGTFLKNRVLSSFAECQHIDFCSFRENLENVTKFRESLKVRTNQEKARCLKQV